MARIQYFQEGGGAPMPEQGGAPQGGDPTAEIQAMVQAMVQEWAQTQDPQLAMQICGVLAEAMGLAGGGEQGGAPAPQGPPEGGQQFKRGGKLTAVQKFKLSKK